MASMTRRIRRNMARNGIRNMAAPVPVSAPEPEPAPVATPTGPTYTVSTRDGESFTVQATNEKDARKAAREVLNVSRLPAGTTFTKN